MDQPKDFDKEHGDDGIRTENTQNRRINGYQIHELPLWFIKTRSSAYYVLGVIEVLLAFRLIFKLLGANSLNGFVAFLYTITGVFAAPFLGIFGNIVSRGAVASSILEPSTIIAMIFYVIVARGIVSLVRLKIAGETSK